MAAEAVALSPKAHPSAEEYQAIREELLALRGAVDLHMEAGAESDVESIAPSESAGGMDSEAKGAKKAAMQKRRLAATTMREVRSKFGKGGI